MRASSGMSQQGKNERIFFVLSGLVLCKIFIDIMMFRKYWHRVVIYITSLQTTSRVASAQCWAASGSSCSRGREARRAQMALGLRLFTGGLYNLYSSEISVLIFYFVSDIRWNQAAVSPQDIGCSSHFSKGLLPWSRLGFAMFIPLWEIKCNAEICRNRQSRTAGGAGNKF